MGWCCLPARQNADIKDICGEYIGWSEGRQFTAEGRAVVILGPCFRIEYAERPAK